MSETARNEYVPSQVTPPGATIRDLLDEQEISQAELAGALDRPTLFVRRLLDGEIEITETIARDLEAALNVPARFWRRRERQYRNR